MSELTYQLVVREGPNPGQVYPLLLGKLAIGRDPMSDIALPDPEISRKHAQLTRIPEGYELQDLQSTNGTFAAGNRLGTDPIMLQPGQTITLGTNVVLVYQTIGATPDIESTMIEPVAAPVAELPSTPEPIPPLPFAEPQPPVGGDESGSPEKQHDSLQAIPRPSPADLLADASPVVSDLTAEAASPSESPFEPSFEPAFEPPPPTVLDDWGERELRATAPLRSPEPERPFPPTAAAIAPPTAIAASPPQFVASASDVVPPNRQRRRNITIIMVVLLLLCCCCAFLAFMWFYGGDWLAEEMGIYELLRQMGLLS